MLQKNSNLSGIMVAEAISLASHSVHLCLAQYTCALHVVRGKQSTSVLHEVQAKIGAAIVVCFAVCIMFSGCSKEEEPHDDDKGSNWVHGTAGYDIYVSGLNSEGYATYWKNGVAHVNKNRNGGAYIDITVSDGDVYTLGVYDHCYYKNNKEVAALGYGGGEPLSIAVSNGVVHVASSTTYWKNGAPTNHPMNYTVSTTSKIAVSGNNAYIAGDAWHDNTYVAAYWKNGTVYNVGKPKDGSFRARTYANSIFVSGNDVYMAGSKTVEDWMGILGSFWVPCYWKNNTEIILPSSGDYYNQDAIGIIVSPDGNVHVLGNIGEAWKNPNGTTSGVNYAYYWKNGAQSMLPVAGRAYSFAVAGNDVYMAVQDNFDYSKFYLIKNGQPIAFESGARIFAVTAAPKGK